MSPQFVHSSKFYNTLIRLSLIQTSTSKTRLQTICLQATCKEVDHICAPSQLAPRPPPTLLRIGKVETASLCEFQSSLSHDIFNYWHENNDIDLSTEELGHHLSCGYKELT